MLAVVLMTPPATPAATRASTSSTLTRALFERSCSSEHAGQPARPGHLGADVLAAPPQFPVGGDHDPPAPGTARQPGDLVVSHSPGRHHLDLVVGGHKVS